MATLTDRKQQAATVLGVELDHVTTVGLQLKQLRKLGVLINIDVTGFSMFTRAASAAEWGIANADERHSRLKGGQKLLIPEVHIKRLRSIETQFRQLLDKFAYDEITYFRPYRWLPLTAYEDFVSKWKNLEKELEALKRELVGKHDEFVDQLADDFRVMAERSWKSVKAQKLDEIRFGKRLFDNEDDFVEHVVTNAASRMPAKSDIRTGITVEYVVAVVSTDTELEAELAESDENSQFNEIWRQELSRKRERIAQGSSPVNELKSALRKRFALTASAMLESVQKNSAVRGKIAKQSDGLLTFFDKMSVTDDEVLRNLLTTLRGLIGEVGEKRDKNAPDREVGKIEATLKDIIVLADEEVTSSKLADRFAALEV